MEDIRIGKISDNKYFIIYNLEAQASATIINENNDYIVHFDFQGSCNRPTFQKWYSKFKDIVLNDYKECNGFIILKDDLKPGMNIYLDSIGLEKINNNYFQPNTLKKEVAFNL